MMITLSKTDGKYKIIYEVESDSGNTYSVIYDKSKENYTCDCANVRLTDCKHIKHIKKECAEVTTETGGSIDRESRGDSS